MTFLRLVGILASACALVPLLVIAGAALSGSDHRWVDIFGHFTAPAFSLAILVILGLALLRAPPPLIGVGVIAALLLLIAVWPQWRPVAGPRSDAPVAARLYFANLWAPNTDVPAMVASIADADADIVVLVETGDVAADNLDLILADHPHRLVGQTVEGSAGVSRQIIAARRPIRRDADLYDGLSAISAVVPTPAGDLRVFAMHLTRPWPFVAQEAQLHQIRILTQRLQGVTGPVVVAGDFNSVSAGRIGRTFRAKTGLTPEPAWTGTWPARAPTPFRIAIDHVYGSEDIRILRRRLGRPTGSDHRPVIVDLAFSS